MSVNPIVGGAGAFNIAISSKQPVKDTPADPLTVQSAKPKADTPSNSSSNVAAVASHKPVRSMSHTVESYSPQGKIRIKFEDSNNNVIYQIPTEMVARTQDLMTNTTPADIRS